MKLPSDYIQLPMKAEHLQCLLLVIEGDYEGFKGH